LSDPVTALPDFIKWVAKICGSQQTEKGHFFCNGQGEDII